MIRLESLSMQYCAVKAINGFRLRFVFVRLVNIAVASKGLFTSNLICKDIMYFIPPLEFSEDLV